MKKLLPILLIIGALFSFTSTFAQKQKAYVKFTQQPARKLIKNEISNTDFFVEYKSKKEATLYLELRKGNKTIGNAVKTVKSKKPEQLTLNIKTWDKVIPGIYSLRLFMFEGPKNTWDKELGQTVIIEDIKVTRLY